MNTLLHAFSLLCITALVAAASGVGGARAGNGDYALNSGDELVHACRQDAAIQAGTGAGLCEGFLLGYIQAHPEVGFEEDLPSEYIQRVMRTRAPTHPETDALKRLLYCLDGVDSLANIHRAIAGLDPASVTADTPARVIEKILQRDYRCSS
jgi:hypothetical protein